jgi:hypothetical protein
MRFAVFLYDVTSRDWVRQEDTFLPVCPIPGFKLLTHGQTYFVDSVTLLGFPNQVSLLDTSQAQGQLYVQKIHASNL